MQKDPLRHTKKIVISLSLAVIVTAALFTVFTLNTNHNSDKAQSNSSNQTKIQNGTTQQPTTSQTVSVTTTPTPPQYDYTNWKTQQDNSYIIKYPNSWYTASDTGAHLADQDEFITSNEKVSHPTFISKAGIFVDSQILSNLSYVDQLAFTSPVGQLTLQGSFNPYEIYTKLGNINIGGVSGVQYTDDFTHDPQNGANFAEVYIVKKGNVYYKIQFTFNKDNLNSNSSLRSQVLNSINFTK